MSNRCIICGCTDTTPCIDDETGQPCGWINASHDVCSNCFAEALARGPLDASPAAFAHYLQLVGQMQLNLCLVFNQFQALLLPPSVGDTSNIWLPRDPDP